MIELEHPKLPGRTIRVHERGVAQRVKAGWRPVRRSRRSPVETPEPNQEVEKA